MLRYTVYLYLENALHISGGFSTHHQEHTQLYIQHLVLVRPLLLPVAIVEGLELQSNSNPSTIAAGSSWQVSDAVDTVVCSPDDGSRHHPKHLVQFPDINKLCKVASCWIYILECNLGTFSRTVFILCLCFTVPETDMRDSPWDEKSPPTSEDGLDTRATGWSHPYM